MRWSSDGVEWWHLELSTDHGQTWSTVAARRGSPLFGAFTVIGEVIDDGAGNLYRSPSEGQ